MGLIDDLTRISDEHRFYQGNTFLSGFRCGINQALSMTRRATDNIQKRREERKTALINEAEAELKAKHVQEVTNAYASGYREGIVACRKALINVG